MNNMMSKYLNYIVFPFFKFKICLSLKIWGCNLHILLYFLLSYLMIIWQYDLQKVALAKYMNDVTSSNYNAKDDQDSSSIFAQSRQQKNKSLNFMQMKHHMCRFIHNLAFKQIVAYQQTQQNNFICQFSSHKHKYNDTISRR